MGRLRGVGLQAASSCCFPARGIPARAPVPPDLPRGAAGCSFVLMLGLGSWDSCKATLGSAPTLGSRGAAASAGRSCTLENVNINSPGTLQTGGTVDGVLRCNFLCFAWMVDKWLGGLAQVEAWPLQLLVPVLQPWSTFSRDIAPSWHGAGSKSPL